MLDHLGSGGMGVVYAAFDAQLDRKVALKLVRTELRDTQPDATRNAMLREAKAMAKVDHPNVITVFEVGTHEDQIFVAMELVTGGDLRAWLKKSPRGWRDTLGLCRQAGAGLAAAHRAGLVHRDFKPDNVLVGSDNRVRVTDFGLARAVGDRTRPSSAGGPVPVLRPSEARLTKTGAIVGTPAYMASVVTPAMGVTGSIGQFLQLSKHGHIDLGPQRLLQFRHRRDLAIAQYPHQILGMK
jgi:serine/threonine protein kinase